MWLDFDFIQHGLFRGLVPHARLFSADHSQPMIVARSMFTSCTLPIIHHNQHIFYTQNAEGYLRYVLAFLVGVLERHIEHGECARDCATPYYVTAQILLLVLTHPASPIRIAGVRWASDQWIEVESSLVLRQLARALGRLGMCLRQPDMAEPYPNRPRFKLYELCGLANRGERAMAGSGEWIPLFDFVDDAQTLVDISWTRGDEHGFDAPRSHCTDPARFWEFILRIAGDVDRCSINSLTGSVSYTNWPTRNLVHTLQCGKSLGRILCADVTPAALYNDWNAHCFYLLGERGDIFSTTPELVHGAYENYDSESDLDDEDFIEFDGSDLEDD
nr:P0 protein [raspberry enamovirus 1]